MKKIFSVLILVFVCNEQFAQIEKGTYVPSISVNINYLSTQNSTQNNLAQNNSLTTSVAPGFGIFVKQNLLITPVISYGYSLSDGISKNNVSGTGSDNRSFSSGVGAGISLAKYKFITDNFALSFGPLFHIGFSEGSSKTFHYQNNVLLPNIFSSSYTNSISAQLNLSGNLTYFLNKNLALTGSVAVLNTSFSYSPYKAGKQINDQVYSAGFAPSFNHFGIGLNYFIRPKVK